MHSVDRCARATVPTNFIFALAGFLICATSMRFWMLTSRSLVVLDLIKPIVAVMQPLFVAASCTTITKAWARLKRPLLHAALLVLLIATYAGAVRTLHAHFDDPAWRTLRLDSDIDDEFIVAAANVRRLRSPYSDALYSGNPISEGPAWVILNTAFGSKESFFLLAPAHATLFAILMWRRTGATLAPLLAVVLALASTGMWESSFGGDMAAAGFAMASASLLSSGQAGRAWVVTGAVLAGAASTVRLPFVAFPLLHGLLVWRAHSRGNGALVAVVGLAVATGSHLIFWAMQSGPYPPFHLLPQSRGLLGNGLILLLVAMTGTVAVWIARSRPTDTADVLACQSVALFVPFAVVALASIWHNGVTGDDWTRYVVPAVPSITAAAALVGARPPGNGCRSAGPTTACPGRAGRC